MSTTTPGWCAVSTAFCSHVDKDTAAVQSVIALEPHPDHVSHLNRETRADSFLCIAFK